MLLWSEAKDQSWKSRDANGIDKHRKIYFQSWCGAWSPQIRLYEPSQVASGWCVRVDSLSSVEADTSCLKLLQCTTQLQMFQLRPSSPRLCAFYACMCFVEFAANSSCATKDRSTCVEAIETFWAKRIAIMCPLCRQQKRLGERGGSLSRR